MNRTDGAWAATRQRLHERWPAISEKEWDSVHEDENGMMALLEARLGYAHANAQRDLQEILRGRSIQPTDVADAETHTGTSGPVSSGTVH